METPDSESPGGPSTGAITASQRRAEIRRRKLMNNSEERMNRIMGIHKDPPSGDEHRIERLDKPDSLPLSSALSMRGALLSGDPALLSDHYSSNADGRESCLGERTDFSKNSDFRNDTTGLRSRADPASDAPPRGLNQYLSRFDEAMKLRTQLNSEKPSPENGNGVDELDSFRIFRLVGCALLAVAVRMFVCKYLSIFAPFLTLQLAFMGLSKYFPKGEKKMRTTVLTAALLLSGIPSEVISRSLDTYSKMADVFTDLCVYFFTFIFCHEILLFFGSDVP